MDCQASQGWGPCDTAGSSQARTAYEEQGVGTLVTAWTSRSGLSWHR